MAVITWRNVDNPQGFGGAIQGMGMANQTFNGAFDKIGEVLKQRTAMDEANWNTQKENNTQAFLDAIGKYRTPEELAAAQASGALDALKQQYGAQVNQGAIPSYLVCHCLPSRCQSLYGVYVAARLPSTTDH